MQIDIAEASPRVDQRDVPATATQENPIMKAMERKVYTSIIEAEKKRKYNMKINPRALVSERKNPIEKNYDILEIVGKGGYGEVKKVMHKELGVIRALKIIAKAKYKTEAEIKMIKNEILIMKSVDHPNIVKLFEFFEDEDKIYIITEFCSGGQLYDKIISGGGFSENKAASIMKQLLSAIAHCHQRKIVHRDIKPENILVE